MKVTSEEYRRGVVRWNPDSKATVRTRTSASQSEEGDWSEPLTDPAGSIALSLPEQYCELRVETGELQSEVPYPVRWERVGQNGGLSTLVLDPVPHDGAVIALAHIPSYGIYHRLVVAASPSFEWEEDATIRVGEVVIRLHSGHLVGERAAPIEHVEVTGDRISLSSDRSGTAEVEGRFIEIIAPGATPEDARLNATAIHGLLAVVFGSAVIGDVVFSEPHAAQPGEPQRSYYDIPNKAKLPQAAEDRGLDAVDEALGDFLSDDPLHRARRLALHWLEHGLRSPTPLDELTCYFVGIEALLNAFAKQQGPIPALERRRAHAPELKRLLRGKLDKETRELLMQALKRVTTRDRFEFYLNERKLDEGWRKKFKELADVRNSAFHGEPTAVTPEIAQTAKTLLITMLKREMRINASLPWDSGPVITSARFHFDFAAYGWHRSPP